MTSASLYKTSFSDIYKHVVKIIVKARAALTLSKHYDFIFNSRNCFEEFFLQRNLLFSEHKTQLLQQLRFHWNKRISFPEREELLLHSSTFYEWFYPWWKSFLWSIELADTQTFDCNLKSITTLNFPNILIPFIMIESFLTVTNGKKINSVSNIAEKYDERKKAEWAKPSEQARKMENFRFSFFYIAHHNTFHANSFLKEKFLSIFISCTFVLPRLYFGKFAEHHLST